MPEIEYSARVVDEFYLAGYETKIYTTASGVATQFLNGKFGRRPQLTKFSGNRRVDAPESVYRLRDNWRQRDPHWTDELLRARTRKQIVRILENL